MKYTILLFAVMSLPSMIQAQQQAHRHEKTRQEAFAEEQQKKSKRIAFTRELHNLMAIDNVQIQEIQHQGKTDLQNFSELVQQECTTNPEITDTELMGIVLNKMRWMNEGYKFYFARGSTGKTLRGIAVKHFDVSMQEIPRQDISDPNKKPVISVTSSRSYLKPLFVAAVVGGIIWAVYSKANWQKFMPILHRLWHTQR